MVEQLKTRTSKSETQLRVDLCSSSQHYVSIYQPAHLLFPAFIMARDIRPGEEDILMGGNLGAKLVTFGVVMV
jgi:hypothetical protein